MDSASWSRSRVKLNKTVSRNFKCGLKDVASAHKGDSANKGEEDRSKQQESNSILAYFHIADLLLSNGDFSGIDFLLILFQID